MKAFCIAPAQIVAVAGSLIADELALRFRRHIDVLTVADWKATTQLGAQGAGLDEAEARACAGRVARFFDCPAETLSADATETIGGWAESIAARLSSSMTQFVFSAAGRDSMTEGCAHAADVIFSDAAAAANLLYGRRRLVSLVAPHSLIGFALTVLTPNLQQIEVYDARGAAPDDLGRKLAFGDAVVATPSLWRYVTREGLRAPDNAMAVSFGEPMSVELAADIRKAGFGAQRELYGSTESGLVGWRDTPAEPFTLFDFWRRDGDSLIRTLPSGETRDVAAMDNLTWETERGFRLGGRRDGAVQIGAVNVFPDKVAETIRSHPLVDDCRIHVARQASGFNRLIAEIKLTRGQAPTEPEARDIDAWCRANLRPQERPRIYSFRPTLDRAPADPVAGG